MSQVRTLRAEIPVKHSEGTRNANAPPGRSPCSAASSTGIHRLDTPVIGSPLSRATPSAPRRSSPLRNWNRTNGGFPTAMSYRPGRGRAVPSTLPGITAPRNGAASRAAWHLAASAALISTAVNPATRRAISCPASPRTKAPSPALGSSTRSPSWPPASADTRSRHARTSAAGE